MSYDFPTFKVDEIKNAIELKAKATTDGKNNLPRTDSRTFSKCENDGISKTDEFRNKEVKRAAEYLRPIKQVIVDSVNELDQKPYYIEQFENTIQKTLNDAIGKLSNLKNAFKIEDNQVRTFKRRLMLILSLLIPVIYHGVYNYYGTADIFPMLTAILVIGIVYYFRREQLKKITECVDKARIENINVFYSYTLTLLLVILIVFSAIMF